MSVDQIALSLEPTTTEHLSVFALEQWLWSAACVIQRERADAHLAATLARLGLIGEVTA